MKVNEMLPYEKILLAHNSFAHTKDELDGVLNLISSGMNETAQVLLDDEILHIEKFLSILKSASKELRKVS